MQITSNFANHIRGLALAFGLLLCTTIGAQQYLGTPGLIHVPSAEMDTACVARVGAHFVEQHFIPDELDNDQGKFNSWTNYLSITPFSWIELGYGYTLWKFHRNLEPTAKMGFYAKDRYFSLRLRPLEEGRYWPAVVVGGNDVWGSGDDGHSGSNFYRNFYVAASKHLDLGGHLLGGRLAYRKWKLESNHKWNGVVGGITYQPAFYRNLRVIGEFDGNGVNAGIDCELFRYFLVQASLQQGKYFSGGLSLRLGLM